MSAALTNKLRVLELFAGIGGCAAALGNDAEVVAAVDINTQALEVYRCNFPHATHCRTLESLPIDALAAWNADLWWLSPPCQPYTRKGRQRDLDDPRAAPLVHLIEAIDIVRPAAVALENVPPFAASQARARLIDVLGAAGYHVTEQTLCPTELGVPNRRRRYYLLASRRALPRCSARACELRPLSHFIDRRYDADPRWRLDRAIAERYASAIDIVDADEPNAITSCFASAYGRSVVRSGSYLRVAGGVRRFAPDEVQSLLGVFKAFRWPDDLRAEQRWQLLGNSLAIGAVRAILEPLLFPLPGGSDATHQRWRGASWRGRG